MAQLSFAATVSVNGHLTSCSSRLARSRENKFGGKVGMTWPKRYRAGLDRGKDIDEKLAEHVCLKGEAITGVQLAQRTSEVCSSNGTVLS